VFHDDQHGTAVVVLAALLNAMTLTGQRIEDIGVVIVGLGAAGIAVADILLAAGTRNIIGCDSRGALHTEPADYLDGSIHPVKRTLAQTTNLDHRTGDPADALEGADLLIGLSQPDQQRAVLPRHLPRCPGRPRDRDHRANEDGRRNH
jgi:malate dehydrogenase (oxaloacetate-decarboxylating)